MNGVRLGNTGINTSPLGFGCSALLGPRSRREADTLLETALAAGITHFDVARAYGSGDAERVLGAFLRRHREETTVTTKFGIASPVGVAGNQALRAMARRAMRLSPRLRCALGRQGARMASHSQFSPEAARASIETSLDALEVDSIDVLLLHEPSVDDCSSEILRILRALVDAGTIRAFGVGADQSQSVAIAQASAEFVDVVQVASDVERRTVLTVAEFAPQAGTITHGALNPVKRLSGLLAADSALARSWRKELDADLGQPHVLGRLLLADALRVNQGGPVVFRTVRPDRIEANAEATTEDPERTKRFAVLARELLSRKGPDPISFDRGQRSTAP